MILNLLQVNNYVSGPGKYSSLQEKTMENWQRLETRHVVEILRVLQKLKYDR